MMVSIKGSESNESHVSLYKDTVKRGNYARSMQVADNRAEPKDAESQDKDKVERGNYAGSKEVDNDPAEPKGTESQDEIEVVDGPTQGSLLTRIALALHEDRSQ